jgi:hypothetical protein
MMSAETVKLPRPLSLKKSKRTLRTVEDVERLAYIRMMKDKVDQRVWELLLTATEAMNPSPPPNVCMSDLFTDEQLDRFLTQACTETGTPMSLVMEYSTYDPQEVDDAIDQAKAVLMTDIDPSGAADHRS